MTNMLVPYFQYSCNSVIYLKVHLRKILMTIQGSFSPSIYITSKYTEYTHLYIYMYICIHMFIRIYIYTYIHIRTYKYVYICAYVDIRTSTDEAWGVGRSTTWAGSALNESRAKRGELPGALKDRQEHGHSTEYSIPIYIFNAYIYMI